ncbi:MAG: SixA phosphatase family protein, partial [Ktedonobacterales bacterium]
RARETAELVGAALHASITLAPELTPGCELEGLAALLNTATGTGPLESVLLVGHEPDLSMLIGLLIGRNGPARVEMKKASCARVDVSGDADSPAALAEHGTLVWLLRAKHVIHLGE